MQRLFFPLGDIGLPAARAVAARAVAVRAVAVRAVAARAAVVALEVDPA